MFLALGKSFAFTLAFSTLFAYAQVNTSTLRQPSGINYAKAHSLEGDASHFHPRDGWQEVSVTDLNYKYQDEAALSPNLFRRKYHPNKGSRKGVAGALTDVLQKALKGLTGLGKPQPVTITWYTGHDLLNPSCWPKSRWTPTDKSFVAALTEKGWASKPKCFEFIELCNTPRKCIFVRVVDTCAGCKANSRHVDLTKAAFAQLADVDQGILKVKFRPATHPKEWHEKLWGPK
ncbi:RlpA-like double-psi beta-barrel-protein domain-containing protein-containing protein [Coprinopsis sp. MPI-PUGE-AT-0042]|nr:RlpA-like double-psi beta-barrel-protein domain-containing protein-containing protein [Coprinopsis sp. MPI-PUGE-AT-0042]